MNQVVARQLTETTEMNLHDGPYQWRARGGTIAGVSEPEVPQEAG